MPNNCLSVLYKRIIQVENKNVGLKVGGGGGGGHKHTIAPPQSKKCVCVMYNKCFAEMNEELEENNS